MLSKEPFNKGFKEIGEMTPYQVRDILFRPEDAPKYVYLNDAEDEDNAPPAHLRGRPLCPYESFLYIECEVKGRSREEVDEEWLRLQREDAEEQNRLRAEDR